MIKAIPRKNYAIAMIDSRQDRAEPTLQILRNYGFDPKYFKTVSDLKTAIPLRPPHVVMFHRSDEETEVEKSLFDLREVLPETHFIILSAASGLAATWRDWGEWIYDCVLTPPVHAKQLIQSIERAAERDTYMYKSEELAEKLAAAESLVSAPVEKPSTPTPIMPEANSVDELREETEAFLSAVLSQVAVDGQRALDFQSSEKELAPPLVLETDLAFAETWNKITGQDKLDDLIRTGLEIIASQCGSYPAVFLRYLPNRRCLVTAAAQRLAPEAWQGLGLNLHEEPEFRISDLRHPQKLPGLKEMAQSLGLGKSVWAEPLLVRDEVYGLWVVFSSPMELPTGTLEVLMRLIENQAQLIDLKNHVHSIETFDPVTQLLNRSTMITRLAAEVVRARRIKLPLSLVIISLDQYRELLSEYGMDEAGMALRALGKIIQPRSRVNDTLGRFGPEELAIILPHTTCQGGAIKAEKIRRLVAAADFSQLLPKYPKLTVSIGVSEYPSTCRDVDDLIATADDALWQIKNKVSNKVCVATPVSGFVPDFQVNG